MEKLEECIQKRIDSFFIYLFELNAMKLKDTLRMYRNPKYNQDIRVFKEHFKTEIVPLYYYYKINGHFKLNLILVMDDKRKSTKTYLPKYGFDGFPVVFVHTKILTKVQSISIPNPSNMMLLYKQEETEIRDALLMTCTTQLTKDELDQLCTVTNNPDNLVHFSQLYTTIPHDPKMKTLCDPNARTGIGLLEEIQQNVYSKFKSDNQTMVETASCTENIPKYKELAKKINAVKPIKKDDGRKVKVVEMVSKNGKRIRLEYPYLLEIDENVLITCMMCGFTPISKL